MNEWVAQGVASDPHNFSAYLPSVAYGCYQVATILVCNSDVQFHPSAVDNILLPETFKRDGSFCPLGRTGLFSFEPKNERNYF